MVNPFKEVNWQPDLAERRKFARSLVIGFPCIALVFLAIGWIARGRWDANLTLSLWLAGAGAGAGILFWLLPQIAKPFYLTWYFLACCIGIVISNLLLAGFYFLVFTPFGVVKRTLGKPAIEKHFNRQSPTYWRDARPARDPARYYKQF